MFYFGLQGNHFIYPVRARFTLSKILTTDTQSVLCECQQQIYFRPLSMPQYSHQREIRGNHQIRRTIYLENQTSQAVEILNGFVSRGPLKEHHMVQNKKNRNTHKSMTWYHGIISFRYQWKWFLQFLVKVRAISFISNVFVSIMLIYHTTLTYEN